MVNDGCHFLQNVKSIVKLLDNLHENTEYVLRIVLNTFLTLSKYVNQDSEYFFTNLRNAVSNFRILVYFSVLMFFQIASEKNSLLSTASNDKIKQTMEEIEKYIKQADKYFITLKELRG